MKVLLRNTVNGWYYQGPSKWAPGKQDALDLGQSAWAVEIVFQQHLENVEILLCYDDPQHNVVLAVERHPQVIPNAELGRAGKRLPHGEESSKKRAKDKPSLG